MLRQANGLINYLAKNRCVAYLFENLSNLKFVSEYISTLISELYDDYAEGAAAYQPLLHSNRLFKQSELLFLVVRGQCY